MIVVCDQSQDRQIRVSRGFSLAEIQVLSLFYKLYASDNVNNIGSAGLTSISTAAGWDSPPISRHDKNWDYYAMQSAALCPVFFQIKIQSRITGQKHCFAESMPRDRDCVPLAPSAKKMQPRLEIEIVARLSAAYDCALIYAVCVHACVWLLRMRTLCTFLLKDFEDPTSDAFSSYSISFMFTR
jgi:hypothetical protein